MIDKKKITKVYITTLPRSGSTLLGQQLGIHSNIFHIGESMYWEMLNPKDSMCSCGDKECSLLMNLSSEIQPKHIALPLLKVWQIMDRKYWPNKKITEDSVNQINDPKLKNENIKGWLAKCPLALDQIVDIYSKHTKKTVFIDNTKIYNIGESLISNNSKWKIIVLIRDPRGVMSSYKNAGIRKGDKRTAQSVLPFCQDFIQSVCKISNNLDVKLVKYEDYCSNPLEILKCLSEFIGVEFEPEMVEPFNKDRKYMGHVLKGNRLLQSNEIVNLRVDDSWRVNLNADELSYLYNNELLVDLYAKYGYNLRTSK